MIRASILIFIIIFSWQHGLAQQNLTFSGSYEQITLSQLDSSLSVTNDVRLYFSPEMDTILFDLKVEAVNLEGLGKAITKATRINFFVSDNYAIATGKDEIVAGLNPAFLGKTIDEDVDTQDNLILLKAKEKEQETKEEKLENQIFDIGDPGKRFESNSGVISGYITDSETGEPIIGAAVYEKELKIGVVTDILGYYSLTLPKGDHLVQISYIGMRPTTRNISLMSDGELNINLRSALISLKEIVITSETDPVDNLQTGFATINVKNIRQLPTMMGEPDIMKIALNLPGVQTVGEGSTGFNVRGGSVDQNLVLLNDVPVYNTSHLFGFVSVFNPDIISGADLYKSGIAAKYGGRVSSVFNVSMKDGNRKKFSLRGGISPITASLTVEGPIKQDTSSYIVGVRATYSDWLLSILNNPELRNSSAAFQDVAGKINHRFNEKNEIVGSGYYSHDRFKLNSDSLYNYSSSNANLQWIHRFSNRFNMTNSVSFADYKYTLTSEKNDQTAFRLDYGINHYGLKSAFTYFTKKNASISFGATSTFYGLQPGKRDPSGDVSLSIPVALDEEKGIESALYAGGEFDFSARFFVYAGLRLSMFNRIGPGQSYLFEDNNPKEPEYITDTIYYDNNELMKTYVGLEPRLSARFKISEDLSLKLSYDRTYQYLHVLTNTTAVSPLDVWKLSNDYIKPQIGDQIALGAYKSIYGTSLQLSVEGYYKHIANLLEYKDGASLLLNQDLHVDILNGTGRTYGIEFFIKKNSGKLTGWFSYTYSRSLIKVSSDFPVETINAGEYYPSNVDKPHAIVLVSNYKINRRVNFSLNFNYSTGQPATFPIERYFIDGKPLLLYSDRNQYRIPNYIRLDMAVNIDGNHKVNKKIHGSWSISIYNMLARRNAYSVFFRSEAGLINGYKLSVFGQAIPTVTYRFALK